LETWDLSGKEGFHLKNMYYFFVEVRTAIFPTKVRLTQRIGQVIPVATSQDLSIPVGYLRLATPK
jgi:hypothetical protein